MIATHFAEQLTVRSVPKPNALKCSVQCFVSRSLNFMDCKNLPCFDLFNDLQRGFKMKMFFLVLLTGVSINAFAGNTACTDFNTQARIAREATKALLKLADIASVEAYYGGVESNQNGLMTISVQPHFKFTKDWYKVVIRNSDCRVISANLFLEKIPIE